MGKQKCGIPKWRLIPVALLVMVLTTVLEVECGWIRPAWAWSYANKDFVATLSLIFLTGALVYVTQRLVAATLLLRTEPALIGHFDVKSDAPFRQRMHELEEWTSREFESETPNTPDYVVIHLENSGNGPCHEVTLAISVDKSGRSYRQVNILQVPRAPGMSFTVAVVPAIRGCKVALNRDQSFCTDARGNRYPIYCGNNEYTVT